VVQQAADSIWKRRERLEQFPHKFSWKDSTSYLGKMQFRLLKTGIIEMSQTINQKRWVQRRGVAPEVAAFQAD